ncbi:LytR/AlgR family response regulator transcription factor [Portibacter marinus]|uniref:LytR/AlgR family response regulator transcription factor n=1 Tax=Portibacter marinus TaxID=2898660 RepID=UPI001F1FF516|nr:LytTR family DNA-binding domain-containing protein [Portibacter marinus]
MKAIIIEDMPAAMELLKKDLKDHCPEVKIIGTAASVVEGAKLLREIQPDLVFLDIMLGDGTGFDLLQILPKVNFKLIFITASDEFAIRAFKYAAIDYLLKPVDQEELKKAVARAQDQLNFQSAESLKLLNETISKPEELPKRISLHTLEKIMVVEIKNIIHCKAEANNTIFYIKDRPKVFVTKTLKNYDKMLSPHGFVRVHQSHLINTAYIHAYIKKDGGYLKMKNGDEVAVSVRKKAEVMEMLSNL